MQLGRRGDDRLGLCGKDYRARGTCVWGGLNQRAGRGDAICCW